MKKLFDKEMEKSEYDIKKAYALKLGISESQFKAIYGDKEKDKDRKQIARDLASWVHDLPKKV